VLDALTNLQVTMPTLAAPMSGGPTTPGTVVAAAEAGSMGFLAAGYKTPQLLAEQIREVRRSTTVFGVNLFAPNPVPVDPDEFRRYALAIQPAAAPYELDLRQAHPVEDDDFWHEKIDLLAADPVPVVSFTFGIPDSTVVATLRRAGTVTVQTVTSSDEARLAEATGVDALVVQASAAGGHWGTLTPHRPPPQLALPELVAAVRTTTRLPVIAAGGVATPADVTAALASGADAVMVGTALLRAPESGASDVHKAALADHSRGMPVLTRAFTGRPARGLPNEFMARYDAIAPMGYPAVHHLTSPLRRAAAAAGNPELVNLWAGTGYRHAGEEPAAKILERLSGEG
jgi:nitronate monooxygenase